MDNGSGNTPETPVAEDVDPVATLKGRLAEYEALVAHLRQEVAKRDQMIAEEQLQKYEAWGNEALAWRKREDTLQMLGDSRAKLMANGINPDAPIELSNGVPNGIPDTLPDAPPIPDGAG